MNPEIIKKLSNRLITERNLCTWMDFYSALIWNKIGFAQTSNRFKIYENTITQNLIFDLLLLASTSDVPLQIYESIDEKSNGNDMEVFLETPEGFIFFPIQAKIIRKGNMYSTINHKISGKDQIELLMEYARMKNGVPLYLLYNYCDDYTYNFALETKIKVDIDLFGCSLVGAKIISENYRNKKINRKGQLIWRIPCFEDLHPEFAFRFSELFCFLMQCIYRDIQLFFSRHSINFEKSNLLTREQIIADPGWRNLIRPAAIGKIELQEPLINFRNNNNAGKQFSPKFRLVFSIQKVQTRLMRLY